jgi:hypothetical protein
MIKLEDIFGSLGIRLLDNNEYRHVVDVLEDLFLKLNSKEYMILMENIAKTESAHGHIFDMARQRPYK